MRPIQVLQGWLPSWSRAFGPWRGSESATSVLSRLIDRAPLPMCILDEQRELVVWANAACRDLIPVGTKPRERLARLLPDCTQLLREACSGRALDVGRVVKLQAPEPNQQAGGSTATGWLAWRMDTSSYIALLRCAHAVGAEQMEQPAAAPELETLRRTLRAKDDFLAELLHELRGPLAPIETAITLLRSPHSEFHPRALAALERQTQHLKRLIEDLFQLMRGATAGHSLTLERIELATVVERAVELASPIVSSRRHRLQIGVPKGLVVQADAVRMVQVFSNLISNAAKYTQRSGTIRIRADASDFEVRVHISDDGIGISADVLPHIFEMFVRGPRAQPREGLGVGLYLVRALVEQHGGRVVARSDGIDRGSEFTVILPLAHATACVAAEAGC